MTIMGISGVGAPRPVQQPQARRGGAAFHAPDAARAEAASGVLALTTPSLLGLQEDEGRDAADGEARRHGHAMLAALAALQRGLLGDGDPAALDHLASLARATPAALDPRLAAVQKAIQVRTAVELARRCAAASV